jgi:hypothetical protein
MIICFIIIMSFIGCTNLTELNNSETDDYELVEIIPIFPWEKSRAISDVLSEFYLSSFSGRSNKGRNIHYTFDGTAWNASSSIVWPTGSAKIGFWGLSQKFEDANGLSNTSIKYNKQTFDYYCDPANPKNLLYASKLNTTRDEQGGKVSLAFNYALANPYFTCVQAIETENVTVIINEVVVHNLKTTGTFEYSATRNSYGTWTLNNDLYGNYTKVLSSPVTLNPDKVTAVTLTDKWFWMPQRLTKWSTTATTPVPITTADANHQCYVELKCKIIANGSYVWGGAAGSANEWESVYYPLGTNVNSQGYNRAIKLKFDGGYFDDGTPFKPREGSEFSIAEWIQQDVLIEHWEEEEPEDLVF